MNLVEGCVGALGMEGGRIKDSDITASSYFDFHSVGPHNARLALYFYFLSVGPHNNARLAALPVMFGSRKTGLNFR